MRYSIKNYGQALAEAISDKEGSHKEDIARNFVKMLSGSGDEAHSAKILKEAERILRRADGARAITIESARPLSVEQKKSLAAFSKSGDAISYEINSRLIAGVRMLIDEEREFDGSLRGKLDKLFGSI